MAKSGEIDYLKNLGPEGRAHAFDKPFSDPNCGMYLMDLGNLMKLLPPPPQRILDLGVGTGWTSVFLAKAGYDVVGVDIADDMIELAKENAKRYETDRVDFIVSDYEGLHFEKEFDCAIFYDALHHAVDEHSAIGSAYRALKKGGVCLCHEPGIGHSKAASSIRASNDFDVTERDMPPEKIIAAAEKAGFAAHELFGHQPKPNSIGPVSGFSKWLLLYYSKFAQFIDAKTDLRKEYQRRNIVRLRK